MCVIYALKHAACQYGIGLLGPRDDGVVAVMRLQREQPTLRYVGKLSSLLSCAPAYRFLLKSIRSRCKICCCQIHAFLCLCGALQHLSLHGQKKILIPYDSSHRSR